MHLSVDGILERVSRLDVTAHLAFRPSFYRYNPNHDSRWYLSMGQVVAGDPTDSGGFTLCFGFSGPSPEEAAKNAWQQILKEGQRKDNVYFLRYKCKPDKSPWNPLEVESMMWVRWSESKDDWENAPTELLWKIPEERRRMYHPEYPDRYWV